jgi:hypothetical protein
MHFGIGHFVAEPKELGESTAWLTSALATSGGYLIPQRGEIILPGDIVRVSGNSDWEGCTTARVWGVARYLQGDDIEIDGKIMALYEPVYSNNGMPEDLKGFNLADDLELVIRVGDLYPFLPRHIEERLDVLVNYMLDPDDEQTDVAFLDDPFYISRVIIDAWDNMDDNPEAWKPVFRSLRFIEPLRAELEIKELGRGREAIESFRATTGRPCRSLPLILFIDDFGIFRNTYRALTNVFTHSLGPHGAKIDDVVANLRPGFRSLLEGVTLEIDNQQVQIRTLPVMLIGDMPQQADSAGFLRFSANFGCRFCLCEKRDRGRLDIDFNAIGIHRTHFDTLYNPEKAERLTGSGQHEFLKGRGLQLKAPCIMTLAPTLDLVRGLGIGTPHSEWRGIGRAIQGVLFSSILTKNGSKQYVRAFQRYRSPLGWPKIQSPIHYMWSWSLRKPGAPRLLHL